MTHEEAIEAAKNAEWEVIASSRGMCGDDHPFEAGLRAYLAAQERRAICNGLLEQGRGDERGLTSHHISRRLGAISPRNPSISELGKPVQRAVILDMSHGQRRNQPVS